MGDIYATARCTLVWLGSRSDDDCDAFEFVQWLITLAKSFPESGEGLEPLTFPLDLLASRLAAVFPDADVDVAKMEHFGNLLTRAWFRRVWIIQEVAKAKQVSMLYGDQAISFEVFYIACKVLEFGGFTTYIPLIQRRSVLAALSNLGILYFCREQVAAGQVDLFGITCAAQEFKSTDPRDKLYALQGMAGDSETFKIRPDYGRNLRELFMEVAIADYVERRHIWCLSCASRMISSRNPNSLPSWVPDWSTERRNIPTLLVIQPSVHAAGSSLPVLSITSDLEVLTVEGKMLTHISKLATSNSDDVLGLDNSLNVVATDSSQGYRHNLGVVQRVAEAVLMWMKECHLIALGHFRITPEILDSSHYEYFARAVMFSSFQNDELSFQNVERFKHLLRPLQEVLGTLNLGAQGDSEPELMENDEIRAMFSKLGQIDECIAACSRHVTGRRFCRTDTGHLGWVPVGTEQGGCACLLFGGDVLYVLRPDGNGHYRLIGECYLEGFMKGEGLDMPGIDTREFHIR